jgi:hypothetical protein
MPFALRLERAAPPLHSDDVRSVCSSFLRKLGVMQEGYDPVVDAGADTNILPPVRALVDCLLLEPDRSWSAAEIAKAVKAPVGQVYRTLLKFEGLDWLAAAGQAPKGALAGKRFRLRFGSLTNAWRFTDLAASLCLERYAALAKAVEGRAATAREKTAAKAPAAGGVGGGAREQFVLRLSDEVLPADGSLKDLTGAFLNAVGVIPDRTGGRKPATLPSFRLFYGAFLLGGERWWGFDDLARAAPSTRPTLLKHLRRLEGLDLLERASFPDEFGFARRHWRLRHGSLQRAFEFTDARARLALDSMGRWAEHIEKLAEAERGKARKGAESAAR